MLKKGILILFGSLFFLGVFLLGIYAFVSFSSKDFLFDDPERIAHQKVGLVLGTTEWVATGEKNLYFLYRIDAAAELYKRGKIDYILVSGDNSTLFYNEPKNMKNALLEKGIPEDRIVLDYAGFRTYDSIVRAKEVFGQTSFVVISQKFHNERALYIAEHEGITAVGYNAEDVTGWKGVKTDVREIFARAKMFWDIMIGTEPKYLGEKVEIGAT